MRTKNTDIMAKNNGQFDLRSTNLFTTIFKWRYHLIIIAVVAAIAGAIFSGPAFIKPRYKADIVMFAPATNSISKMIVGDNPNIYDPLEFGEENQTEQLLQILNSKDLKDRVIKRFGLMQHYGIDSTTEHMKTKLYDIYDDNVSINRTQYMGIEVEVLDTDPELACKIANGIGEVVDSLKFEIQQQRALKTYLIAKEEYLELKEEISDYEDTLTNLNKMGINDWSSQIERYTEQYAIALRQNNRAGIKNIEEKLSVFRNYGTKFDRVKAYLWNVRDDFYEIKMRYNEAKIDLEKVLPAKYVVEKAQVPDKKSFPIRWLIVVIAVFSALLIGILAIVFIENMKKIQTK